MMTYRIRVKEHLSDHWQGYFAGLSLYSIEVGGKRSSELSGTLDDAALHAVIAKLRDLNLHLVSVDTLTQRLF